MRKEFVIYDLALRLKWIGYNEECPTKYGMTSLMLYENWKPYKNSDDLYNDTGMFCNDLVAAPLWQQAFDWLEEEYKLYSNIVFVSKTAIDDGGFMPMIDNMNPHKAINWYHQFPTKLKAKIACLDKLISLVETNKKELMIQAYSDGKTIQSNHSGEWQDFVPQNQVDRPNFEYGRLDNWRIKP